MSTNQSKSVAFGRQLRSLRKANGLNKADVGRRYGVDASLLARLERGDVGIGSVDTLTKLAKAYDVTPTYLIALAGYESAADELPNLRPYLRTAHGLDRADVDQVENFIEFIKSRREEPTGDN